jgi:predicted ATPase/transcriptional regulator with XRE-family HTH domain
VSQKVPPMSDLSFGAWLRQRRRELDLTQAELAERLFCAKGTVRRLEADDLRPSKQLAEQIAAVLAVPTEQRAAFIAFARSGAQDGPPVDFVHAQSLAPPNPAQPAARPSRRYPLPSPTSTLLGRAHTVEAAVELLLDPDVRLVTLVGPPGVGKTRLALAIAREIQAHFREGVCFVPLAPVSSAERVLPAIAQALDLLDSGRPLAAALVDRLRGEEVLLVLDNLEHLLAAAAEIAALLAAAAALKILCTSRTALRIVGEHEFLVPPLPLPDLIRLPGVDSFAQNPALALFVARAQAIHPGFAVTIENLRPLAEICHRLDGLPLAIELAATRIKLFSPAAILARLDRRLPFLTGGHRDAPARQRTLEAAIAWSYDLLDDAEKRCLARLGVFRGGWTLEAAEAICGAEIDVVNRLAALVDQSLIQTTHTADGDVRFHILETIREFALLRLGEEADAAAVQERHARYYLDLAVTAERQLQGSAQAAWMNRLHAESKNLRAAFAWSLSAPGDVAPGLRAGAALWWFWWTDGQVGEGRQWLGRLIARAREMGLVADAALGPALLGAGILAFFAGEFAEAIPHLMEARAIGVRVGDQITQGYAIFMLGTVHVLSGQPDDGHVLLEQGSATLRSAGNAALWQVGVTSLARTLLSFERGDLAEAQRHADNGMRIFHQLGQPYGIGLAFNYQGDVARQRGELERAAACYQAALPLLQDARARSEIPAVLHNLGHVFLAQGDVVQAANVFAEGLELQRAVGNRMGMAECLVGLASTDLANELNRRAVMRLGAVDALLSSLNIPLFAADQAVYQRTIELSRLRLDAATWQTAYALGQSTPPNQLTALWEILDSRTRTSVK